MYLDKMLQFYLDELASAKSTPGGGSTAAVSGAMGAALASMVSRLTIGKADYANVQSEVDGILQKTEHLRERFQQLMQADIDAYGTLAASFKLPRTTDDEKITRSKAIQEGLVGAALVPLEMVECSAELARYCLRIAEIGNANVLSDIATGAMLASAAGTGAAWMVRANLQSMKDLSTVTILSDRLGKALDTITEYTQQITSIVGERA